jgi:hypothetical protein
MIEAADDADKEEKVQRASEGKETESFKSAMEKLEEAILDFSISALDHITARYVLAISFYY